MFIYVTIVNRNYPYKSILAIVVAYFFLPFITAQISTELITPVKIIIQILVLYIFLLYILQKNYFYRILANKLFIFLILAHIYLIMIANIKGVNWLDYLNNYRSYLNNIILLILILLSGISIGQISKNVKKILLILFLFELFVAILTYFGPGQLYSFFEPVGNRVTLGAKLVSATFLSPSVFSNTMVILFFTLFYLFHIEYGEKFKRIYLLLLLGISAMVLLSGIRTSLISLILGIGIYFSFYRPKLGLLVLPFFVIFINIGSIYKLSNNYHSYSSKSDNPFDRMKGATILFKGTSDLYNNQESNLYLSMVVLSDLPGNILIGSNKFYGSGYGIVNYQSKNSTDVTLALLLTEYGLFGVCIYLFPFLYILRSLYRKKDKDEFRFNFILFIVLLSQTVSDKGLFLNESNIIYFLISGLQMNKTKIKKTTSGLRQ